MIYTFVFGTCEFGAEQWEEGLGGLKIYHFWELFFFTNLMLYPETTTQVFNLLLVNSCLENLHFSSGSM